MNHGLQNGILTSSLTKSKLLKRKLKKPTEQNINAFKKYCIIFDKVKKMAKESYFNLELELNKKNLKKTCEHAIISEHPLFSSSFFNFFF